MKQYWLLVVFFSLAFAGVRTYLALSVQGFSDDGAYLHLRNAQHIMKTGVPIVNDVLILREGVVISLFDYILAAGGFVMPLELAAKILPNLFAILSGIVFFILSFKLSNNWKTALFSMIVFNLLPVFFSTLNAASEITLVLLLFSLLYISLLTTKPWLYVLCLILLVLVHPSAAVFILGLCITVLLLLGEKRNLPNELIEILLFSIFFTFTVELIMYVKPLQNFGIGLLAAAFPKEALPTAFKSLTILGAAASVGIVTIIFALTTLYSALVEKKTNLYYIIGLISASSILLWFKLVPAETGMLFFGYATVLLFSAGYSSFAEYLEKTRLSNFAWLIHSILVIFILTTTSVQAASAITERLRFSPDTAEKDAAEWITQYASDMLILTVPERGNYIAYMTEKKVILDTKYHLMPDAQQKYSDISRLFSTSLEIEAVTIMEKYGANLIYSPPHIPQPKYVPSNCLSIAYNNGASVYAKSSACKVSTR